MPDAPLPVTQSNLSESSATLKTRTPPRPKAPSMKFRKGFGTYNTIQTGRPIFRTPRRSVR